MQAVNSFRNARRYFAIFLFLTSFLLLSCNAKKTQEEDLEIVVEEDLGSRGGELTAESPKSFEKASLASSAPVDKRRPAYLGAEFKPVRTEGRNSLLTFVPSDSFIVIGSLSRISYESALREAMKLFGFTVRDTLRKYKSDQGTETNPLLLALIDFGIGVFVNFDPNKLKAMGFSESESFDFVFYFVHDSPVLKLTKTGTVELLSMFRSYTDKYGIKITEEKIGSELWHFIPLSKNLGGVLAMHFGERAITLCIVPEKFQSNREMQQFLEPAQQSLSFETFSSIAKKDDEWIIGYLNTGSLIDNYTRLSLRLAEFMGEEVERYRMSSQCSKELRALSDMYPELSVHLGLETFERLVKPSISFDIKVNNAQLTENLQRLSIPWPVVESNPSLLGRFDLGLSLRDAAAALKIWLEPMKTGYQCEKLRSLNQLSNLAYKVEENLDLLDKISRFGLFAEFYKGSEGLTNDDILLSFTGISEKDALERAMNLLGLKATWTLDGKVFILFRAKRNELSLEYGVESVDLRTTPFQRKRVLEDGVSGEGLLLRLILESAAVSEWIKDRDGLLVYFIRQLKPAIESSISYSNQRIEMELSIGF